MLDFTCELLLAAISHTGLQVLQLDLYLLIVPHGLFALSPVQSQQRMDNIYVWNYRLWLTAISGTVKKIKFHHGLMGAV